MLFQLGKRVVRISCLFLAVILLAGSVPSVSYAKKSTAQQIKDKENEKGQLEEKIEELAPGRYHRG